MTDQHQADFIAPQQFAVVPEKFQAELIDGLVTELLRDVPAPCVLRSPTGSGKTFVVARAAEIVTTQSPTVWFWFVPFTNLVQQTESTLAADARLLHPIRLDRGRNQNPTGGMVIITTAASVGRAKSRKEGYDDGVDDFDRSMAQFRSLARARGLKIGVIIDEAHIGVESQTEFGQFVHWLEPDRLIMATATPKDKKLNDFIAAAGYDGLKTFSVSRDDVVNARLNKRYIEAVIYSLRESLQGIADLQATVLKQAWRRNVRLSKLLEAAGVNVRPLLLVQVGSGSESIKQARDHLVKICGVQQEAIGEHSADAPDPVLMAQIANDTTKDVLIFKQSAGTGFDAPRAFVLASTKPVNDPDFAMQFVGRVMRVHRNIRTTFPKGSLIPEEIDSAYVYLANAETQTGFEAAVHATSELKTNLQGQTEALVARATAGGGLQLTNRPDPASRLFYENSILAGAIQDSQAVGAPSRATNALAGFVRMNQTDQMFNDPDLDQPVSPAQAPAMRSQPATNPQAPQSIDDVLTALKTLDISAYRLQQDRFQIPVALKTENRPVMNSMAEVTRMAAARLPIDDATRTMAVRVATGRVTETEVHKELHSGKTSSKDVAVVIERRALATAARTAMQGLPQFEDADAAILVEVLSSRMMDSLEDHFSGLDEEDRPDAPQMKRLARDCAHWVVLRSQVDLAEALFSAIADQASTVDAAPLPDVMIFPGALPLADSQKNIYGVMPPAKAAMQALESTIPLETRGALRSLSFNFEGRRWTVAEYDGGHTMGDGELAFAKALDRAGFVKWWHRNPDRKPYSVRLVRGEHKNHFHPDFIVFLEHFRGDEPLLRLIETKESTKDASNKSQRFSEYYGRVLFITENKGVLRSVNQDGSLGEKIDPDNLDAMREWLRQSRPASQE